MFKLLFSIEEDSYKRPKLPVSKPECLSQQYESGETDSRKRTKSAEGDALLQSMNSDKWRRPVTPTPYHKIRQHWRFSTPKRILVIPRRCWSPNINFRASSMKQLIRVAGKEPNSSPYFSQRAARNGGSALPPMPYLRTNHLWLFLPATSLRP